MVIKPKKASVYKLTPGTGKLTVKAGTKVAATGGKKYQIQYRAKGTSTWKSVKTTYQTKTIKNLKKGNL